MKRGWIVVALSLAAMLGCGLNLLAQAGPAGAGPLMGLGLQGKWWDRPMLVRRLGLTPEQRMKMNEILQQHRLHLVDLRGNLQKAEIELEPMVDADQLNDGQVMAQVTRIAEARAQLEEGNARLLLDIRHQLTPQQWQQVRQMIAERRARMEDQRRNGMGGMGQMRGPMNRIGPGGQGQAGSGPAGAGPTGPAPAAAPADDGSPDGANLPPVPSGGGVSPQS